MLAASTLISVVVLTVMLDAGVDANGTCGFFFFPGEEEGRERRDDLRAYRTSAGHELSTLGRYPALGVRNAGDPAQGG